ncbi:MAG: peptide deformylase [Ruoffia tabacinasalis]|uniref:peptide deformylase n=1 Tax=unclassified Ruoffia TaxID=2862149 RepID=UPI000EE09A56|nr:peptide deformylase [Aerococcaceae bacterium]
MITMKDFVPEKEPILREKAKPVEFPINEELKETAVAMRQFLINSQDSETAEKYNLRPGVGVAAPQIGIDQQIFAVYLMDYDEEGNETEPLIDEIFVNPKIISHAVQKVALKEGEGCLSVPREVPGIVPRPKRVTVKYNDLEGNEKKIRLRDYEAVVVQHEIDHIKGILFYDHIDEKTPWEPDEDTTLI